MGCGSADRINIPMAQDIGPNAFAACYSAQQIIMPKAISIGYNAFQECSGVSEIDIPEVETIDENAFRGCYGTRTEEVDGVEEEVETGLVKIDAPKAYSIGSGAFWGCKLLKEALFANAFDLGDNVFTGCKSIEFIDVPLAEKMKQGLFGQYSTRERSNTLCSKLKFLNIRSMRSSNFWDDMFYGMDELKCINMNSVDYGYVNSHRPDLGLSPQCDVICQDGVIETLTTSVDASILNVSRTETIHTKDNRELQYVNGLKDQPTDPIDIYDVAVGCVEDSSFQDQANVRSIYFPSAIQIGLNAFRSCKDLEAVRLPTLTDANLMGVFAFKDCDKLRYIDLGSLTIDQLQVEEWGIPSKCVVTCADGAHIVP